MSEPDLHWRPKRVLQRASNVLTSNGNPVAAFAEVFMEREDSPLENSVGSSLSRNGLRASIKRKLQGAKDIPLVRSISLRSPASSGQPTRRQTRAFSSDSSTTRPQLVYTNSPKSFGFSYASRAQPTEPLALSPKPPQLPFVPRKPSMADVVVPQILQKGVPMTKVSAIRQKNFVFQLDPDQGQIVWESKKRKIIPIENIKELRSTSDARYYREQFQLAQEYEDRWLTIVYIIEGNYKTLHLIASTKDIFQMWDSALRKLYSIRQELMSGLGNVEMRQAVWEKQYWKGADDGKDEQLDFEETEKLCKRLNVNSSTDALLRLFKQADVNNRGYLDFPQFQRFVKMLKARPELDRLYKKICSTNNRLFDFPTFEVFMRNSQQSSLSQSELQKIFVKYATSSLNESHPGPGSSGAQPSVKTPATTSPVPASEVKPELPLPTADASVPSPASSTTQPPTTIPASPLSPPIETYVLSLDGFTAFLLSTENSAFTDHHGKIWHDMTRPLSEYYISTSHNTYLVGHQLVGVSTIEGYIRALLHSCRSVELDIYDGDREPVIFHGKTLTTKVALREVCHAIAKYAFVASPYPVIISAEIHCSLPQQDMMADIMKEVFGDSLICAPIDGQRKIEVLPSPEDLKRKVLLKAKNLYVSSHEAIQDKGVSVDTESSSTEASASEPELIEDIKLEWQKARAVKGQAVKELKEEIKKARDSEAVKELKDELKKARDLEAVKDIKEEFTKARHNVIGRIKGHGKTPSAISQALVGPPTATAVAVAKSSDKRTDKPKVKMSMNVVALLVYTVGVKCRGINKKEHYAPEHVFSLSENTANKILKQGMHDLIKHTRTHVVRIYPKGLRFGSTNYEPHRYWSAGAQLVAINWQTFDMGYMINHSMFQRNGRSGYVLKPLALRSPDKDLLSKRTKHILDIKIISAQQLPRLKDASGREIVEKAIIDPFVEVSIHVPDWTHSAFLPTSADIAAYSAPTAPTPSTASKSSSATPIIKASVTPSSANSTSARTITYRTGAVKNNGFNPVWQEDLHLPFDCVGDMMDLVFVRFAVRHEGSEEEPLAVYCASLGSLQRGYRHLPLHDAQMSQYLFSTLFVQINVHDA